MPRRGGGGQSGPNVIDGNNRTNTLTGTDGDDIINGRGGDDTIDSNGGSDTVTGGAGADTFVIDFGTDTLVITDFENGVDHLDITAFGVLQPGTTVDGWLESNDVDTTIVFYDTSSMIELSRVTLIGVPHWEIDISDYIL